MLLNTVGLDPLIHLFNYSRLNRALQMTKLLELIIEWHPAVQPDVFVKSAVCCLLRHGPLPRHRYAVCVRNCPTGEQKHEIVLDCQRADILTQNEAFGKTLQAEVITEFGAIGLAMLYVSDYTDLRVVEVTLRGERADYWLGAFPGEKARLLEVSGIDVGSEAAVDQRERDKKAQVRKNSTHGKPFFVSVSEFANGFALFSQNDWAE